MAHSTSGSRRLLEHLTLLWLVSRLTTAWGRLNGVSRAATLSIKPLEDDLLTPIVECLADGAPLERTAKYTGVFPLEVRSEQVLD